MKKKLLKMLGILSTVLLLAGCTRNNQNPGPFPQTTDGSPVLSGTETESLGNTVNLTAGKTATDADEALPSEKESAALSNASLKLLNTVLQNNEDQNANILLSPVSIDFAMGMTENGADGNTLSQMEETVNGGIKVNQMNPIMKHLSSRFINAREVKWNVANSIWYKNDGTGVPKEQFLNATIGYYDSELFAAPFDETTLTDINNWVDSNTDHMIPEILDVIPVNVEMYLVNAIAFDGEWAEEYEEDHVLENRFFTNLDGTTTNVTMLSSKEHGYFELGDGKGFIKPYKGGEYSFVGIMPNEGVTPEDYIAKLADKNLDFSNAIRNSENIDVNVSIPEFSNDYGIELSDTYKKMGMTDPFGEAASFENMMEDANGAAVPLYIGRILHKTHIDVDRKGTKAAAATVVEMRYKGIAPVEETKSVILDKPFVYAIVENETGLPVFIGCQNCME